MGNTYDMKHIVSYDLYAGIYISNVIPADSSWFTKSVLIFEMKKSIT